jgi:hypothetical protein
MLGPVRYFWLKVRQEVSNQLYGKEATKIITVLIKCVMLFTNSFYYIYIVEVTLNFERSCRNA